MESSLGMSLVFLDLLWEETTNLVMGEVLVGLVLRRCSYNYSVHVCVYRVERSAQACEQHLGLRACLVDHQAELPTRQLSHAIGFGRLVARITA